MNQTSINNRISTLIYGRILPGFQPAQNEQDAWIVIDWLLHNRYTIDLKALHPQQVCAQALKHEDEETKTFYRNAG